MLQTIRSHNPRPFEGMMIRFSEESIEEIKNLISKYPRNSISTLWVNDKEFLNIDLSELNLIVIRDSIVLRNHIWLGN